MFPFLRQVMEEKQAQILQLETIPAESTTSMNISTTFLKVLQLLFKVKYMDENTGFNKKRNNLEVIDKAMDVLHHDVTNDVLTDTKFDDIVALSNAYYNMGLEYITSTDINDLTTAIKCFDKCLSLLELDKCFDSKVILTSIGALNELYLASEVEKKEKDNVKYLNRALELYTIYMDKNYPDPIHIPSLVGVKEKESNPRIILNTLHLTTVQELGRQYLTKSKDKHEFVKYMHKILNIRLTDMVSAKTKFDVKCLDMAFTLFDLSRYFLANGRFGEAKSHIVIEDYVILKFTTDNPGTKEENRDFSHFPNYKHKLYNLMFTNSAKSWGSYGVSLLYFSMEKFSQNKGNKSSEIQNLMSKIEIKSEKPNLIFSALEKELKYVPIEITETCILNFDDAKSVFEKTLKQLQSAKKYFTPDRDIVTYAEMTLKISDTYKYFADFEEQRDEQIKLHQLRVACLETACKNFRTTDRSKRELQIYKRIWYELVTSCSMIMDLMIKEAYYDKSFKETSMKAKQYAKIIARNIGRYLNVD
ncbi:KIF-binding protein-like [Temnothorax longispinosus]|uniref:KIF-binding protein-like n=1 Tax=Temnothorax longispinosus TaxID=300112 RepID=UPI003A98F4CA